MTENMSCEISDANLSLRAVIDLFLDAMILEAATSEIVFEVIEHFFCSDAVTSLKTMYCLRVATS